MFEEYQTRNPIWIFYIISLSIQFIYSLKIAFVPSLIPFCWLSLKPKENFFHKSLTGTIFFFVFRALNQRNVALEIFCARCSAVHVGRARHMLLITMPTQFEPTWNNLKTEILDCFVQYVGRGWLFFHFLSALCCVSSETDLEIEIYIRISRYFHIFYFLTIRQPDDYVFFPLVSKNQTQRVWTVFLAVAVQPYQFAFSKAKKMFLEGVWFISFWFVVRAFFYL